MKPACCMWQKRPKDGVHIAEVPMSVGSIEVPRVVFVWLPSVRSLHHTMMPLYRSSAFSGLGLRIGSLLPRRPAKQSYSVFLAISLLQQRIGKQVAGPTALSNRCCQAVGMPLGSWDPSLVRRFWHSIPNTPAPSLAIEPVVAVLVLTREKQWIAESRVTLRSKTMLQRVHLTPCARQGLRLTARGRCQPASRI